MSTKYYCAKCKAVFTDEAEAKEHEKECGGTIVVLKKFGSVIS